MEFQKSQSIRLFDVLALGPFMIYLGARRKIGPVEGNLLVLAGVLTILYNGQNYLRNLK